MKIKKYTPPAELMRTVATKYTAEEYAATLDTLPECTPTNKRPVLKALLSAAAMLVIAVTVTALALISPGKHKKQANVPATPDTSGQQAGAPAAATKTELLFIRGNLVGGAENGRFVADPAKLSDRSLATLLSKEALYTAGDDGLYGIFILANKNNEKYGEYATGQYYGYYYIPLGTEVDKTLEIPNDGVAFSQDEIDNARFHDLVTTAKISYDDDGTAFTDIDGDGNREYLTMEELTASLVEYDKDGNIQVIISAPTTFSPARAYTSCGMLAGLLAEAVFGEYDTSWYEYSPHQLLTSSNATTVVKDFCNVFYLKVPEVAKLNEYYSYEKVAQYAKDAAKLIRRNIILPESQNVVLNGVKISDDDFERLSDYVASKEATEVIFRGEDNVEIPSAHSLMLDNKSILITNDSIIINRMQFKYDEEFLKPIHECSLLNADEYDITVTYNGQTKEIRGHDRQHFVTAAMEQWRPLSPECEYDVTITFNGQTMYYHTECTSLSVNGGSFIGNTYNISTLLKLYFNYVP